MNCRILSGNVFDLLPTITPGSVDCAVTSPPYWFLRSYLPKGQPLKALELGQEKTPAEYVANMVRVCGLVRDCLAPHGTLWLNVGDSYSTGGTGSRTNPGTLYVTPNSVTTAQGDGVKNRAGIADGNLCLIPQRLTIALQDDGWLVRSVIIWHKPSAMPCSVTGWLWKRCKVKTKAGQSPARNQRPELRQVGNGVELPKVASAFPAKAEWSDCPGCKKCQPNGGYVLRRGSWRPTSAYEPVIMLAKSSNYFADGEAVKTPPAESTVSRDQYTRVLDDPDEQFAVAHDHETTCDSGANLRDVWRIASEPLREKHYAAYPSELVYRCLAAGTSQEGYCKACGSPWVRVMEQGEVISTGGSDAGKMAGNPDGYAELARTKCKALEQRAHQTIDWRPSCRCPDPSPRPGVALDPFSGSGRTAIVARRLGLDFIGCELNEEYVAMSKRLVKNDAPLLNDVM